QLGEVDWFDDVQFEAGLPARLQVAIAAIPAEGDESWFAWHSSEPPRHVEPAPVGQPEVADVPGFPNQADRFVEIVRHGHACPSALNIDDNIFTVSASSSTTRMRTFCRGLRS